MAEGWNTWESCVDNTTDSGWNSEAVLTTGSLGVDLDSNSPNHGRHQNKSEFKRNDNPNSNWKERKNDGKRNYSNNNYEQNNTKNETNRDSLINKKRTGQSPRNRNERDNDGERNDRGHERFSNRNETNNERRDHWNDRNRNNSPNNWQERKNDGRRNDSSHRKRLENSREERNNSGNNFHHKTNNHYEDRRDNKYNNPVQQNIARGRPHEAQNRNANNRPPFNKFHGNSDQIQGRDGSNIVAKGPRFEKSGDINTCPDSNTRNPSKFNPPGSGYFGSQNKSDRNAQDRKYVPGSTRNDRQANQYEKSNNNYEEKFNDSSRNKRKDIDKQSLQYSYESQVFRRKPNHAENIKELKYSQKLLNQKKQADLEQFQEPPQLFTGEGKPVVENDFEDNTSSKFSSKSESITSSDQHETEMKILNIIHEFKTTLHLVEIKPSLHVQTEIRGLQKYIGLIFEKWNPKLKGNNSSSDSESSDSSSDEEQTKKNKKNKQKKKNKRKSTQKENEETKHDECNNKTVQTNAGIQNLQKALNSNVKQFQENTANFLNHQPLTMQGPGYYVPPLMPTPPYPPMLLRNPLSPFPLHPGNATRDNSYWQMHQNSVPLLLTPTNTQTKTMPNSFVKSQTTASKLSNSKSIPNNSSDIRKNLGSDVLSIVNDIRVSGVTMSKDHIKEVRVALDKFPMVNINNFAFTDLSEDFKNINVCMLKIVENETISCDTKYAILHLLEELFKNTCDEKTHCEVEHLVSIYQKALDNLKNNSHLDYDVINNKAFEQFQKLSKDQSIVNKDQSIVNKLLAFKETARETMSIDIEHSTVVVDTSSVSENESEDKSSEDENSNSDDENDKENKAESNRNNDKRKANVSFAKNLGPHCKCFLRSAKSIEEQVNHALSMYIQVQSPEYKSEQKKVMYLIKDIVKKMYPNCILHLFGSRVSNMALPDSDMDIYIDVTGQGYCNSATYEDQQMFVKKIRKLFYQRSDIFSNILGLVKTKVPIIKLHHKNSAINCDISFKNGISVENTNLMCYYLSLDPRVKWLVTAVKLWAHYNHMYASDYFTSHALCWLVLFYLMTVKIVPPVLLLKTDATPRIIDHWDIAIKKLETWNPAVEPASRLVLLKDFFRFLIDANLTGCVLCTHTGEFISKESINDLEILEVYKDGIFKEYVERTRRTEYTDLSAKENPSSMPMQMTLDQLCIQDPFEFSKNISNPVRHKKFEHFNTLCHLTVLTLEQLTLERESNSFF